MIKTVIAGLGDIAPIHISSIDAVLDVMLTAVCDLDPGRQSVCPGPTFYTDYIEMLEQEKPDVVHLCLPHYLHFEMAKAAAERGIHVFCEKPVAVDLQEAAAFMELEREHPDLCLGICLQNRKNNTTIHLKDIIASGTYGRLMGIRGFVPWYRAEEYYREKPWRGSRSKAGSGVMLNQAIHTLDLLSYLGGEIKTVKAMTGQLLDYGIEVEDTVAARFSYSNGAAGLFFATNANYVNESVSIQVELEKGTFLVQNNMLYQVAKDGELLLLAEDEKMPGTRFYYGSSHKTLIREFYQAVAGDGSYIHISDAWAQMALVDAIFKSSQSGKCSSIQTINF